jgi:hypothetical protein
VNVRRSGSYRFIRTSPAIKKKNAIEITPFKVKNAAFSFDKSEAETKECS